jgi:hypothetical protein
VRAARDDARPTVAGEDRMTVTGDAPAGNDEPDQAPGDAVAGHPLEGHPADEVAALLELDDPAEAGVERIRLPIELVAVERHARLQAQGVARTEPAR